MNYLVTGASGFLGKALVHRLTLDGHTVTAISRKPLSMENVTSHRLDITNKENLKHVFSRPFDGLFHLAGLVSFDQKNAPELFRVNVRGTENILSLAVESRVPRILSVSSCAVMGPPKDDQPMNETTPFSWDRALFPYQTSKYEAQTIALQSSCKTSTVVVVNPAFVFGEGDDHSPAMQLFLKLKRRPLPFYPPGGSCFVWVGDVVQGMLAAFEKGRAGESYILGGENVWHKDAYTYLAELVGGVVPRFSFPRTLLSLYGNLAEFEGWIRNRPPRYTRLWARLSHHTHFFSSQKAHSELGYEPISFRETMSRTATWLRSQGYL